MIPYRLGRYMALHLPQVLPAYATDVKVLGHHVRCTCTSELSRARGPAAPFICTYKMHEVTLANMGLQLADARTVAG
jgi:hypothetical protein